MQPQLVIFDFGGVLFQWQPAELLTRVLANRIHSPAEAEHWKTLFFQGYDGDWGQFDRGEIDVATLCRQIAQRTGLSLAEVQAVIDAVPAALAPMPDTIALLRRLKDAGHRLVYLSNMPEPFARHLEQHHDFLAWFDDGVFSSRVHAAKPDPHIFHLAFERFGVAPAEAVFIDDHPANIDAARAVGLPALLFTSASTLARDLAHAKLLPLLPLLAS